jgi:CheY-like chemotaxis protein
LRPSGSKAEPSHAAPRHKTIRICAPDEGHALAKVRILVAEDDPISRLVLRTLLNQIGLDPDIVGDGLLAVEAWRTGGYDLVLMDLHMPEMDGVAATRAIRAEEHQARRRRTPIVGLTIDATAQEIAAYLDAGMDGRIAKPVEAGRLFAAIHDLLDENQASVAQPSNAAARA